MRTMMINTCQILICLFAVSNGQIPTMSVIGGYVNKSGIAYITCTILTNITGSVAIARNGGLVFECPVPNVCVNPGVSSDYNATQDVIAGTTTLIIQNADQNRDGGNWTCSHSGGTPSVYVSLTVVTKATSKRMIEERDKITLELICTYPTNLLSFVIYLGGVLYLDATPNRTVYQACTPNYEASVNYTLTFPPKHSQSYNGIFNVYIYNGFYNEILVGSRIYTFEGNKNCERELGCGIGLGLGIPCVITCIIVVICIFKGYTYAYQLGLLLGLGFGITFQVSWIIIVSLISTGNPCKLELGLALGLSSGIPCVITFIIAVIFIFVEFKGFPSRVNIGKGIITGLLIASVIGIIVVYFLYEKLKADLTDEEPEEKPTEPNNKEPEEMPLGSTDKKNKTKHTGSSSAVSREHVEIQVEKKGVKGDEEKRPPAIHIRTQNRVESEPTNKKTSDKPQPLPPVGVVTEDRSKHRPQPPPPENSDVKDPNKRGISANFDDKQGLPTEPPRSSRLPPLTPKQPTVEEEDASKEKPKKKRKNRKKKGQMNEETQAEEMEELQNKTAEDQFDGD